MEEKYQIIADFNLQMISDFFISINRQGPGSEEVTRQALSFITGLNSTSKIADLGCGTGGQTFTLADNTEGKIIAMDFLPDFVKLMKENVDKQGYSDRISIICGSMDDLPFAENEMDLIWAEGSIYNVGYENGLNQWNKYLKQGGFVAVSEASWFTNSRPKEIEDYWQNHYSEIDTIPNKVRIMADAGYRPVAHFMLPEYCWTDNFFDPLSKSTEQFLDKYKHSAAAKNLVDLHVEETRLYNKYKDEYGYVFYIGQKI